MDLVTALGEALRRLEAAMADEEGRAFARLTDEELELLSEAWGLSCAFYVLGVLGGVR